MGAPVSLADSALNIEDADYARAWPQLLHAARQGVV